MKNEFSMMDVGEPEIKGYLLSIPLDRNTFAPSVFSFVGRRCRVIGLYPGDNNTPAQTFGPMSQGYLVNTPGSQHVRFTEGL